jgi:dGTP triphosphohydrolase
MTVLIEAADTCVTRLEALQSRQRAVSAFHADFNALAKRFVTEVDARKQERNLRTDVMSPAVKDMLKHCNVGTPESSSVEQALRARRRKVAEDIHRSSRTVEDALRAHLSSLPVTSERLLEVDGDTDARLLDFEQDIQKLRDAVDRVDLALIDEADGKQARFIARWAET